MIDAPHGFNPQRLPLLVRIREIFERLEREGDVVLSRGEGRFGAGDVGDVYERDAVVLVVVVEEGDDVAPVADFGAEEGRPEGYHLVELLRAEDDVGEGDGGFDFGVAVGEAVLFGGGGGGGGR